MIHKARFAAATALLFCMAPALFARAERRDVSVSDSSTSGKLVRINLGASAGLSPGAPVLFSTNDKKLAAGRVLRVGENSSVVAVLERFGEGSPEKDNSYELLYGEPFPEAADLPSYVSDQETETPNPGNERFLTKREGDFSPDLDDDSYTPEITLSPRLPESRTYSAHNFTIGYGMFRNRVMPATESTVAANQAGYTTYGGYAVRYAYTFRTHYWFKSRTAALISIEAMLGVYNFDHTFPATTTAPVNRSGQVRVFNPGVNVRYMVEVNKLFRLYPYVGLLYNIASAETGNASDIALISGGRLIAGAGAQLVVSDSIDARVDAGSDGILGGLVVKF